MGFRLGSFLKGCALALLCALPLALPWVAQGQAGRGDVDRNSNGLIEIDSLLMLHNMRHNLAGTSYKTSPDAEGNDSGCPDGGCKGYELMKNLDFDGNDDGSTWQSDGDGGYTLDAGDSHAVYFPVASGAGGWLPIGDAANPFVAVFDGNGYAISNLAIRRDQIYIGLFAVIGEGAAIRDLGLSGNLAQQTGPAPGAGFSAVGGLVGWQEGGSITNSYATGDAAGGGGNFDNVGGLVGRLQAGTIRASHATGAVAGGGGGFDHVGGLVGYAGGGSIVESHATGDAAGGGGDRNSVGGLVGFAEGVSITASHAKGYAVGGDGRSNYVGGLVGWLDRGGSILASYATGEAAGGDGALDRVGGLVGRQFRSLILASYATGDAAGGGGKDLVGGLVGLQEGLEAVPNEICRGGGEKVHACEILCGSELDPPPPFDPENPRSKPYCELECDRIFLSSCGFASSRPGSPREPSMIVASYATGTAFGGDGNDLVGGLVGRSRQSDIVASYALGDADGGIGKDHVGELVGLSENFRLSHGARVIIKPIDSYGFGHAVRGEMPGSAGPSRPIGVSGAFDLSGDKVGELTWNEARSNTLSVWDFGTNEQIPALRYADYDGSGNSFINCGPDPGDIPENLCGTLLPGQVGVNATGPPAPLVEAGAVAVPLSGSLGFGRVFIESWSWRQLEGPLVEFSNANASETTFTAPATSTRLVFELTATDDDGQEYSDRIVIPVFAEAVDRDGDGLIEIDSLAELHNMRHNLAGTSYKASANAAGNSLGCPGLICEGYELRRDLDFDLDRDGSTWSGSGSEGYTLDRDDHHADYFPVDEKGAGGWLPIGDAGDPLAAFFEDSIGDASDPFVAVFEGNSHTISNLAIRRNQVRVGLFGKIGEDSAAIRNLGLIDNLADYTGGPPHTTSGRFIAVGGLVGEQSDGSIRASYATGPAAGGDGVDSVGGLVGWQESGSITASHATGAVAGGDGGDRVGGLVGQQQGLITASYATGAVAGGDGGDRVGGLVGWQRGPITASYATGVAAGGDGNEDFVGGLVGWQECDIRASYATGAAAGGDGDFDEVGGLVGRYALSPEYYCKINVGLPSITASYATGAAAGGAGRGDTVGWLIGFDVRNVKITDSYGFGVIAEGIRTALGRPPNGLTSTVQLTAGNAGLSWGDAGSRTLGAWDFGTDEQMPALNYADYDGGETVFDCDQFPAAAAADCADGVPFTLLPGQADVSASGPSEAGPGETVTLSGSLGFGRVLIESWSWRQLEGPEVRLSHATASLTTFTAPVARIPLVFELTATDSEGHEYSDLFRLAAAPEVDRDHDGLIEIYSLAELHNMRHNLAGTSYKTSPGPEGNSFGCPDLICEGYELMQHLDFDGDDDGSTWSENNDVGGDDGYTLDSDDSNADYFLVDKDGAGGWEPIGDGDNPFAAVFDGNGRSIRNLAIRRSETFYVGLFGAIGDNAAIRNLGLIDNLADYTGSSDDFIYIGGLVGLQNSSSITASYATGAADGGDGNFDYVGGLVGWQSGSSITASYATGAAAGGDGKFDYVGGLVGWQSGSSITASYATGAAAGGDGANDTVGGLVGWQEGGSITASYATGAAAGGDGGENYVGGLVGLNKDGSITASYATGAAAGGDGYLDYVGGLVGRQFNGSITASYATGAAAGGDGGEDYVGGLVGLNNDGSITASYATGAAAGGDGDLDYVGGLVGLNKDGSITESYGFGVPDGEVTATVGLHPTLTLAVQLTGGTEGNAGSAWDDAGSNTLNAWDFGTETQMPALNYADYDGEDTAFSCDQFPANACPPPTLLPGQADVSADGPSAVELEPGETTRIMLAGSLAFGRGRVFIKTWSWEKLQGPEVTLSDANARETSFTVPAASTSLVFELTATDSKGLRYTDRIAIVLTVDADHDGDGLIEIYSLTELHNMRHNLAGTSYRASPEAMGNSAGCPDSGCFGYELMRNLDFDADADGSTWFNAGEGYVLDAGDSQAVYFPVNDGAGGWLPIGDGTNPFNAFFDGNGYSISNLAIRRDQTHVGLFGRTGSGAAIRNLGLIDNLADYIGSSNDSIYIGGLVGQQLGILAGIQKSGSITASYATGVVAGGDGDFDYVGGLVGWQEDGSITASYATGVAAGGDGFDRVGGLVGVQAGAGAITASYAAGVAAGGDGRTDHVGGLVGWQASGSITASYATAAADGGDGDSDRAGGLVGFQEEGSITASYATGAAAGGDGDFDYVGGLVGWQAGGSITASYATGAADGGAGFDRGGGLVGLQSAGTITASYGFGSVVDRGDSGTRFTVDLPDIVTDTVLIVEVPEVVIVTVLISDGPEVVTASVLIFDGSEVADTVFFFDGDDAVIVTVLIFDGETEKVLVVDVHDAVNDTVLVVGGHKVVTVAVLLFDGHEAVADTVSALEGSDGSRKPEGVGTAAQLTADNAGPAWNDAGSHTLGAWDFGTDEQIPALNYADYDGTGTLFAGYDGTGTLFVCSSNPGSDSDYSPAAVCGTPLPDQAAVKADGPSAVRRNSTVQLSASPEFGRGFSIASCRWRQLQGPDVGLSGSAAEDCATRFTAPATRDPLVFELTATGSDGREYSDRISIQVAVDADLDGNGLIEIYSLTELHNMRHNMAGTSYKSGADSAGDSSGCPSRGGCKGYELMQDLDFDVDGDGGTWLQAGAGYVLDAGDSQADYFPVNDGAGGWLPIGDESNPFVAEFDGNGYNISNLGIRRDQAYVGLFGRTRGAAIRNIGLIRLPGGSRRLWR